MDGEQTCMECGVRRRPRVENGNAARTLRMFAGDTVADNGARRAVRKRPFPPSHIGIGDLMDFVLFGIKGQLGARSPHDGEARRKRARGNRATQRKATLR